MLSDGDVLAEFEVMAEIRPIEAAAKLDSLLKERDFCFSKDAVRKMYYRLVSHFDCRGAADGPGDGLFAECIGAGEHEAKVSGDSRIYDSHVQKLSEMFKGEDIRKIDFLYNSFLEDITQHATVHGYEAIITLDLTRKVLEEKTLPRAYDLLSSVDGPDFTAIAVDFLTKYTSFISFLRPQSRTAP